MNTGTNPHVWVMVGAPGSGKSTWRKELVKTDPSVAYVCADSFRAILGTGAEDQSVSYRAFEACYEALRNHLTQGHSVVVDATNMYRKTRKKFIQIARGYGATVEAVVFELDKATLLERIKKRVSEGGLFVPELAVDHMLSRYQRPTEEEFDKVTFVCKIEP